MGREAGSGQPPRHGNRLAARRLYASASPYFSYLVQNASRVRNPVGSSPSNAGVGASVCAVRSADEGRATTAAAATALRAAAAESARDPRESDTLLSKRASMVLFGVEGGRERERTREKKN